MGLQPAIIAFHKSASIEVPAVAQAGDTIEVRVLTWIGLGLGHSKGETRLHHRDRAVLVEPIDDFTQVLPSDGINRALHRAELVVPEAETFYVDVVGRAFPGYRLVTKRFVIEVRVTEDDPTP